MADTKNLLIAFSLAIAILFGWDFFVTRPMLEEQKAAQAALEKAQKAARAQAQGAGVPGGATNPAAGVNPAQPTPAAPSAGRVKIESGVLRGSINLAGARLDDLWLTRYRETIKPDSPQINLLKPSSAADPYFIDAGWVIAPGSPAVRLPDAQSIWVASAPALKPGQPVTLSWDNGAGQLFKIVYALDENYLFTITQSVENKGQATIAVRPYALISRTKPKVLVGTYVLHEGAIGAFDTLEEIKYSELEEDTPVQNFAGQGGWVGFTDKYWLTALMPNKTDRVEASFRFAPGTAGTLGRFQADALLPIQTIAPNALAKSSLNLFAGAKEVRLIEHYNSALGLTLFDRAIDWGWFWFLTKPIFWTLDTLFLWLGNFGVAIILLTLIIKLLLFPLAHKSYVSMNRMKILQPKMKEIQERHKDDRARQQQEMMDFMRKEKLNPLGGCLPLLMQAPVFYALYKTIYVTIEVRHQPFMLWIKDLSAADPLTPVNLFGLLPFTPPSFLAIGVLPIIMGITMWAQMKLSPSAVTDPIQQRVFSLMPILFTFMMAPFSAGLVLYWTVNNILSIAQQWILLKQMEAKEARTQAEKTKPKAKAV